MFSPLVRWHPWAWRVVRHSHSQPPVFLLWAVGNRDLPGYCRVLAPSPWLPIIRGFQKSGGRSSVLDWGLALVLMTKPWKCMPASMPLWWDAPWWLLIVSVSRRLWAQTVSILLLKRQAGSNGLRDSWALYSTPAQCRPSSQEDILNIVIVHGHEYQSFPSVSQVGDTWLTLCHLKTSPRWGGGVRKKKKKGSELCLVSLWGSGSHQPSSPVGRTLHWTEILNSVSSFNILLS